MAPANAANLAEHVAAHLRPGHASLACLIHFYFSHLTIKSVAVQFDLDFLYFNHGLPNRI